MLRNTFASRHIGIDENELGEMLRQTKVSSIDQLIDETVPASIRLKNPLALPAALSENKFLKELKEVSAKNNALNLMNEREKVEKILMMS